MKLMLRKEPPPKPDDARIAAATGLHPCGRVLYQAELRRAGDRIEVGGLQHRTASGGAAEPGEGSRAEGIQALANGVCCIAALPAGDVMTRWWTMPRTDPARFRQMVAHRLEADLPVSLEMVCWDYRFDGRESGTQAGVLVQAVRTERASGFLQVLKQRGLRADMVTTEAEAISALWQYGLNVGRPNGTGADVLILASAQEWLVTVFDGPLVRVVRRIPVDAGEPKRTCLACRQAIEMEQSMRHVRGVRWCATPEADELRQLLSDRLEITVEPITCSERLVRANGEPLSNQEIAVYGPAIGLALVGLFERANAVCLAGQREDRRTSVARWWNPYLAYPWRWTAAALGLALLAGAINSAALSSETARMKAALAASQRPESEITKLEPRIRTLERTRAWRMDVQAIMAELCAKLPGDVVIASVQLSREKGLVLKGTCGDSKKVYKLVEDLRGCKRFENVQPGRTEPGRGGAFTITAGLADVRKITTGQGGRWR